MGRGEGGLPPNGWGRSLLVDQRDQTDLVLALAPSAMKPKGQCVSSSKQEDTVCWMRYLQAIHIFHLVARGSLPAVRSC